MVVKIVIVLRSLRDKVQINDMKAILFTDLEIIWKGIIAVEKQDDRGRQRIYLLIHNSWSCLHEMIQGSSA